MPIESRVSTLLGARREGITDLARGAGISRTTAHTLYYATATRVDFETLEKLCRYFDCGIGDLLVYRPEDALAQEERSGQPVAAQPS